ncbi:MAG: hypothetical protein ACPGTS_01580, partial [Minisyncoccia bacterium]
FHIEDVFVLAILSTVAIVTHGNYIEWIGVAAVFMTFKHTVVAFRLEEVLEKATEHGDTAFNSHGRQKQFYFMKEILWFLYFLSLGAYSALIGVFIFLLYPWWHDVREKYHTQSRLNRESKKQA